MQVLIFSLGELWDILSIVKKIESTQIADGIEKCMCEQLIQYTFDLDTLSSDRLGQLKSTMKTVE